MNGNVPAKFDWLPPCGPHSATGEVNRERRRPLGRSHIHLRRRADLHDFFFFFFALVRKPSGDQLVTRRPWVSTREYGGWRCTGERERDGDMPEMVKKQQRDASSLMKCRNSFSLCCSPEAASGLKIARAVRCRD